MNSQSGVSQGQLLSSGPFVLLPGILLAAYVMAVAMGSRSMIGIAWVSPMILSIILGLLFRNVVGLPPQARPGITFCMKRLLRLGIVLLGLQLTLDQVADLGIGVVAIVAVALVSTFVFMKGMGRLLGVSPGLTDLLAAGTSVCGASAVMAANTVSRASDGDVAYAIASVTLFGSMAMFAYPLLAGPLGLDALAYGLWTGATVHEVAQVAAAGFQLGDEAGQYATIAKLSRVAMLAPLILAMAIFARRGNTEGASTPMPWFVLGFVAMVVANSLFDIPTGMREAAAVVTAVLLTTALAAMGLQTDIRELRAKGLRPLLLGALGWVFIAVSGLFLLKLAGY